MKSATAVAEPLGEAAQTPGVVCTFVFPRANLEGAVARGDGAWVSPIVLETLRDLLPPDVQDAELVLYVDKSSLYARTIGSGHIAAVVLDTQVAQPGRGFGALATLVGRLSATLGSSA